MEVDFGEKKREEISTERGARAGERESLERERKGGKNIIG